MCSATDMLKELKKECEKQVRQESAGELSVIGSTDDSVVDAANKGRMRVRTLK